MTPADAKLLAATTEALRAVRKMREAAKSRKFAIRIKTDPGIEAIYDALLLIERSINKADIPMDAYAVPDAARYKAIMSRKSK